MNGEPRKKSPWVYVAIGCGVALLLVVLGVVGVVVLAVRKGKQIEAEMKDPTTRAAKVREVLGGDVPDGYHPVFSMSIPFLMDMAMLGDHPPDEKGAPSKQMDRGFMYINSIAVGGKQDELKKYFEGTIDDPEALRRANIHVDVKETIRRGTVEVPGQETLYLAQRGTFAVNQTRSQGLTTMILVDCPQDARQRIGFWFGPDPAPDDPVEKVDWTGSVADEAALRDFLGHFKLCGK
ncbi:MAG TPA: hypothetical protein VFQ51_05170 [Vicinamibacteria bacterium]|nr:hypothetical protein [Vicinamibacteria bacterium]